MALLNCPDCNHQVSELAHQCPSCGRPRYHQSEGVAKDSVDPGARVEWQLSQIRVAVT